MMRLINEALGMAPVTALSVHPRNANQGDIGAIHESIDANGFYGTVVAQRSTGYVLAGNHRLLAAQQMGAAELPVAWVDVDDATALRILLADNRTTRLGMDDPERLVELLQEILADAGTLDGTGYDAEALDELLTDLGRELDKPEDPGAQVDRAAELQKKWGTERGQVWEIPSKTVPGKAHRVMCGDSTSVEDVGRLLPHGADICMTDPPYGADIQYASHDDTQDALVGLIAGFMPLVTARCKTVALTPGINNVFHYPRPDWMLCWFYGAGTGHSPWGFTAWQPFLVYGACPKLSAGEGCHPDGFQFMMSRDDATENRELGHACPKPLSVWERFMERLSNKDTRTVYDPFVGAGTTMVAAEHAKLLAFGMEIDPAYVAVTLERMAGMGLEPRLVGDT